ncbi:MAG: type II 3-dehydroquinate dehydratase, partial [bacterium]
LHEAADKKLPVIINPAAFTHYSYAIRDAVLMLKAPVIEVHLSNPLSREEFRHTSVVSGVVNGTISGFGLNSYRLALIAMKSLLADLAK